jgi:hypothetical protein
LSLAISGEREPALSMLEDQLLRSATAPPCAPSAFVLALTGDTAGADRTARGFNARSAGERACPRSRPAAEH